MLQTCAQSFIPLLVKLCDDMIPGEYSVEHPFKTKKYNYKTTLFFKLQI